MTSYTPPSDPTSTPSRSSLDVGIQLGAWTGLWSSSVYAVFCSIVLVFRQEIVVNNPSSSLLPYFLFCLLFSSIFISISIVIGVYTGVLLGCIIRALYPVILTPGAGAIGAVCCFTISATLHVFYLHIAEADVFLYVVFLGIPSGIYIFLGTRLAIRLYRYLQIIFISTERSDNLSEKHAISQTVLYPTSSTTLAKRDKVMAIVFVGVSIGLFGSLCIIVLIM